MAAADTVAALAGIEGRGAGTDAERRAAAWLCRELRGTGREASLETFWSRPNWALAHAWHVLLALTGSLVSVASPKVGGAIVLVSLVSLIFDAQLGVSIGRRLTPERASQNVISPPPGPERSVRLILTANYDSGRMALVHRGALRRAAARARRLTGAAAVGWRAWLALTFAWLLLVAVLRSRGAGGPAIGVVQLVPTAGLILALALLFDLAVAQWGPGAGDNASGVALALALARVLDVSAPRHLEVALVLQGASDGTMAGLARHLRARRRERRPDNTVVLGLAPSGGGRPCWWTSDGSALPLRYLPRLTSLTAAAAGPGTELAAAPHRGRGVTPALPARHAGLPAISVGALDADGLAPRSHLPSDRPEELEPGSLDRVLELALTVVDAIDADVGRMLSGRSASSPADA